MFVFSKSKFLDPSFLNPLYPLPKGKVDFLKVDL